jgi:hypothetical protein
MKIYKIKKFNLDTLQKLLLCDKIRLSNIPQKIRVLNVATYLYAFRVSRTMNSQRFREDLDIMRKDLKILPPARREQWLHYYWDSIEAYKNKWV